MRLLTNARIHTMDPGRPLASALLLEKDRILDIGDAELTNKYTVCDSQDMDQKTILPGFIDSHFHLQLFILNEQKINCEVTNKEEILEKIADKVKTTRVGEWILGHGWNQNSWGGGWPTKEDLDSVAPLNPVYLTAKSLHAGWANSSALRRGKIKKSTRNPQEGMILRDGRGHPSGVLLEKAMTLVERVIPQHHPEDLADLIDQAMPKFWSVGLTGIHNFDRELSFRALQILNKQKRLGIRVLQSIPREDLEFTSRLGLRSGMGDDLLRIGPVKLFADGALGPRTAAMLDSYEEEPDARGMLLMSEDEMFEYARDAVRAGLSLAIHAIGDRANRVVLDMYSRLREFETAQGLPALRHRIEHVQILHPADTHRLAELEIIASMQPIHVLSDMEMADKSWGDRARLAYAWQTQAKSGTRLAFGSDAPVENHNPFWGISAALTRRRPTGFPGPDGWYPSERLRIQEAIEAYTVGAAFAAGMEDQLGKLAPGYLADLIVLERDPFECDPMSLRELKPCSTMVAGNWVWNA